MIRYRRLTTAILLVALLPLAIVPGAARAAGAWTTVEGPTGAGPIGPTALLRDGRVLALGPSPLTTAKPYPAARFDPATGRWSPAADLPCPPCPDKSLTVLPDGRVLAIGGLSAHAAIYDPAADRWDAVARPGQVARDGHSAMFLGDGGVLLVGGGYGLDNPQLPQALPDVERYDPAAGRWERRAPLPVPLSRHAALLLADSTVLVVGRGGEAFRYDPAADRWATLAAPPVGASVDTTLALPDGSALVVGGDPDSQQARAARFDPATGAWRVAASPARRHNALAHSATLASGLVLLLDRGGAALYDPYADRWEPAPLPNIAVTTLTPLRDGRVLAAGYSERARTAGPTGSAIFTGPPAAGRAFPATGFAARGRFLAYWEAHGGLPINGYPLSDEFVETLDGIPTLVQYFERTRLEYHPENAPPHDVLLGQFGRAILAGVPAAPTAPVAPRAGHTHDPVTGHNMRPRFQAYWAAHGGLAQFGHPLTEEFEERLEDGNEYTVQYFERARFELHPGNAPPHDVLLGQFGRHILGAR